MDDGFAARAAPRGAAGVRRPGPRHPAGAKPRGAPGSVGRPHQGRSAAGNHRRRSRRLSILDLRPRRPPARHRAAPRLPVALSVAGQLRRPGPEGIPDDERFRAGPGRGFVCLGLPRDAPARSRTRSQPRLRPGLSAAHGDCAPDGVDLPGSRPAQPGSPLSQCARRRPAHACRRHRPLRPDDAEHGQAHRSFQPGARARRAQSQPEVGRSPDAEDGSVEFRDRHGFPGPGRDVRTR